MECPFIEIRQGASTLAVRPPGDNAAMSLRYQGTFVRGARECAVVAGQMVMKVGVEGRIVSGRPAVRVSRRAAARRACGRKTDGIEDHRHQADSDSPVWCGSRYANRTFTHVEEGWRSRCRSAALEDYTVYIGFDPLAAEVQEKTRAASASRSARPKPGATSGPAG